MLRRRPQVLGVELNRSVSAARQLTRWRGSTHKGRPVRNVPRKKQGGHYLHRERAASTEVARQYRKLCPLGKLLRRGLEALLREEAASRRWLARLAPPIDPC